MELSVFTIKILILFLPGLISFIIIDNLTIHKQTTRIHWFIYTFLLSFLCYSICILGEYIWGILSPCYEFKIENTFFYLLLGINQSVPSYLEIIFASGIAIVVGLAIAKLFKHNGFYKYCIKLGITNRHGYSDTLSYMLALYPIQYITIRDWKRNIVIIGELVAMSEVSDVRDEIVLQNCSVYSMNDNGLLYEVAVFYLPTNFDDITIEIMEEAYES